MNEQVNSLAARAARHAALGEPARLRLLDLLTLGDLSPTEVRERLGMTSNLVSHHLGVLENAGLITRTRSEGDARRSYVSLRREALAHLAPSADAAARRVVFVCTANSARSQLAEMLWRTQSSVPTASAGTHPAPAVAAGAVRAARRHGMNLGDAKPRSVTDVVRDTDLVITVCDSAYEERAPRSAPAPLHWSVPDPVPVGSDAAFDAAFDDLMHRVAEFAPRIRIS
ncbi:protein-tyrosine-phosphatase/DNA-binding transcriptional ArsR family regulator [Microbacterium endophyticum]|uniref:Protein-tyrosine-phosphatase/DNA-binding transcriptional ArsR family regulator n=1 Tax=Microbacterium endophyticum TaxID=1526412 RepID=A0A7W4YLW6_9MICO|nr:metalloregulator ArsR/SmtB family transcription factor [Microbacterium endophyticum]MBB2975593.1 protein-tyrosine-phosphatase/DNA-binding transcriptional ArsR family regulator [Microbacterium endophyticum]NIK35388.1 protein-tyrosine-phosphatase/DNA-binding transcriptional ArsR family regulator [Microbacterium endophyticum]